MTANDILNNNCVEFFDDLYTTGLIRPTFNEYTKGIFGNGIKFVYDNYNYSYVIYIADSPTGDKNYEKVWQDSQWTKQGPWEKHIINFIDDYLDKIKIAKAEEYVRVVAQQVRREQEYLEEQARVKAAEKRKLEAWT